MLAVVLSSAVTISSAGLFDKTEDKEVSSVMVKGSSGVSYFGGSRSSTGSIPSFTKINEKSLEQKELWGFLDIRYPQKEGWLMIFGNSTGTEIPKKYYMGIQLYGDDGFVQSNRNESSGLWKKCWEATTDEECFVTCPANEKLLKVVLKPAFNLEVIHFRIFEKQDGKWDRILKKNNLGEMPLSYETCLSASGEFFFKINARTINEIDDSTSSFGEYKLIWGGDVLVEKEYPVPTKKGQFKEVFRFGSRIMKK